MRKQKRQTVKKLIQCVAIIAAGVLAIILFMWVIWYRGKNSEPVTDEQVAAQMQQAEPLVIETPEAATEGSIRVYDYDGCCIYSYYGKIRINNDGKNGKDIDVEAIGYLEGYRQKQILYTRKYTIFCYISILYLQSIQSLKNSVYRRRPETQFLKCCKRL